MKKILNFHSDSGHGWLEVTLTQINDVGFKPSDFSFYSYRKNTKFYLEEDCDAFKFLNAYKVKHEVFFKDISYDGYCFIRDLPINKSTIVEQLMDASK
jgi:hypothetical protein